MHQTAGLILGRVSLRSTPGRRVTIAAITLSLMTSACTRSGHAGSPRSAAEPPSGSLPSGEVLHLRIVPAPWALAAPIQREVAVAGGRGPIYLAGGLDASGQSAAGVFALNPRNGRLRQLGNLPHAVHDAAGAIVSNQLVVFGGGSVAPTDLIQSFDLRTHGSSVVGHLPNPLADLTAASSRDATYLVGGFDGMRPQRAIYRVSSTLALTRVGTLPVGLRYPAVAADAGGNLVIAGGDSAAGPVSTVYVFNTNSRHVTLLGHLRSQLGQASAFVLDGRVFIAGGMNPAGRPLRSVYRIDPSGVRAVRPLPHPLADAAATQVGRAGWILGGWRGRTVAQVLKATLVV